MWASPMTALTARPLMTGGKLNVRHFDLLEDSVACRQNVRLVDLTRAASMTTASFTMKSTPTGQTADLYFRL